MKKNKVVNFKISSLDPLAQGVSKENGQIIFIPKTLPGETGTAEIYKATKHVYFAKPLSIETTSQNRIQSPCVHYEECGGCQFLHCSYSDEIKFKSDTLKDIFARQFRIELPSEIEVTQAPVRFNYRNRVQLQYDKRQKILGFYNVDNSEVIHTTHCLMPKTSLATYLKNLYEENSWLNLVKNHKNTGHIEVYERDGEISVAINERYSHIGFSQVYKEMNDKLLELVSDLSQQYTSSESHTFDLFGGSGNLSQFCHGNISVIDSTPEKFINLPAQNQKYIRSNLYAENATEELIETFSKSSQSSNFMIIDPPRSGFKTIDKFTQAFSPKTILYVSCNPQTLARDISKISENYSILNLKLLDFFPGTKHFESVALLQRKNG